MTSPDGITWTPRAVALGSISGISLRGISYNGGYYVVVSNSSNISLKSSDGINWIFSIIANASGMFGIASNGTALAAVGINTISSIDGTNWAVSANGTTNWLYGVAYGAGRFAAVGQGGTILTSP